MKPIRALLIFASLLICSLCASAQEFKVAYNESYAPLSYVQDGKTVGLEVDLMDELGKRMKLGVRHEGFPWERAQYRVRTGEADAFVTLATPARREYALMSSQALLRINIVAATSASNPNLQAVMKIKTLEDSFQFKHVSNYGSGWAKINLAKAKVDYLQTTDAVFGFLLLNRADVYVESDINIYSNAKRLDIQDKLHILPVVFESVDLVLGISMASPFAPRMAEFEAKISEMKRDGTIQRIKARYGYRK